MRVKDVLEHFLSRASWVNRERTVDRIIAGDPEKDLDRCLVTWMPRVAALRHMIDRGIGLLVCHEPTFWNHPDRVDETDSRVLEKQQMIQGNELAIVRNHDCWDRWPDVGIPWAWARVIFPSIST